MNFHHPKPTTRLLFDHRSCEGQAYIHIVHMPEAARTGAKREAEQKNEWWYREINVQATTFSQVDWSLGIKAQRPDHSAAEESDCSKHKYINRATADGGKDQIISVL